MAVSQKNPLKGTPPKGYPFFSETPICMIFEMPEPSTFSSTPGPGKQEWLPRRVMVQLRPLVFSILCLATDFGG